jgi:hypothetical protein
MRDLGSIPREYYFKRHEGISPVLSANFVFVKE